MSFLEDTTGYRNQPHGFPQLNDDAVVDIAQGGTNAKTALDAVTSLGFTASAAKISNRCNELLNKYEISNDILHSHDAEDVSSDAAYTKKKTITLDTLHNTPSTIRISFDLKSGTFMTGVYGKIYKNGGAVGTERTHSGDTYIEFTEDLSFEDGDTLELWTYSSNPGVVDVLIQNFRVEGVVHANTLQDAITDTHVGLATPFEATNS